MQSSGYINKSRLAISGELYKLDFGGVYGIMYYFFSTFECCGISIISEISLECILYLCG